MLSHAAPRAPADGQGEAKAGRRRGLLFAHALTRRPPPPASQSLNKGNERSNIIVASTHIADGSSALLNWAAAAGDFMPDAKVASAPPEVRLQKQMTTERLAYSFVKIGTRRAPEAGRIPQASRREPRALGGERR